MKAIEEFISDPIKYLETSIDNVDKMSDKRKINIIAKSSIIGIGTGLCTFSLSILTGSSHSSSTSVSIATGILATGASLIYKAHQHGIVDQTRDKLSATRNTVKKNIKALLGGSTPQ